MKKTIAFLVTLALLTASMAALATTAPAPEVKELEVGAMMVYDFGDIKLHAYETKDPISDENFLLETPDELIVIELVGFYNNIEELQQYIDTLGKPLTSVIVAYHPAGGDAYPDAEMYASEGLGEAGLVAGFVEAFGDAFDGNLPEEYALVEAGPVTIGGVDFNVIETADAFDLEIPAINVYLTHMLGSNTHNILASAEQIDAMIAEMEGLQTKSYALLLTGHDIPRGIEVAAEKIAYLEKTKELMGTSQNAEEFLDAMATAFPDYAGQNYLKMSAGMLFANP